MGWVEDRIKQRELEVKRGGQNPTPQTGGTADSSGLGMVEQRMRERGLKPRTSNTPSAVKKDARPVMGASAVTPAVIGAKIAANVPMPTKQPQESIIEPMKGIGFGVMNAGLQEKQKQEHFAKYGAGNIPLDTMPQEIDLGGEKVSGYSGAFPYTMTVHKNENTGKFHVIPTYVSGEKGIKTVSKDEAERLFKKSGKTFGEFDTEADAKNYIEILRKYFSGTEEAMRIAENKMVPEIIELRKYNEEETRKRKDAEDDNFFEWLGKQAIAGAETFNRGVFKTLDFIIPDEEYLPLGLDVIGKAVSEGNKYYTKRYEEAKDRATRSSRASGTFAEIMGELIQGGVAAAPGAAVSWMSAYAGLGTTGSAGLGGVPAMASTMKVSLAPIVRESLKNPQTHLTLLQTLGPEYEQAIEGGANEAEALIYAFTSAGLGSLIEVSGGTQKLPGEIAKGENPLKSYLKSIPEEAMEEVNQGLVSGSAEKILYNPDKEIFSITNEDAIINPQSMLKEAGMGGGVAALLGAPSLALQSKYNANQRKKIEKIGEKHSKNPKSLIDWGLESTPGSDSFKIASELKTKLDAGEDISPFDLGRLAIANNKELRNEIVDAGGDLSLIDGDGAPGAARPTTEKPPDFTKAGFTKTEFSGKVTNKQIRALDAIGKALGVNISIGAPTGSGEGSYNGFYDNGRIVIAQDADNPLEVVLAHEVTHHMKKTSPVEYQKFVELAVNASEKINGEEKAKIINEYKTMYSEGTEDTFTDTQAIDELAADFTRNIVKDIKAFRNLINADKNVAQRFLEGVKSFITKVKSTFSGDKKKMDTAAQEKYGASISELEAAVSSWEKMFAETEAGVKDGKLHNLSINEAVEETNDLIAVHNASEDQIIEALRRGQFFMPSVAVTNKGFSKFGDISVVFNKGTIDPEESSGNRLYGSDAWTPTQTELKKNPKFDDGAVEEALYGIRETIGEGAEQLFTDDAESFKQKVADADGSLYNAYAKDMGMQTAYAIEKGLISEIPTDGSGNIDTEKLKAELDAVMDADSEWRAYKKWLSGISGEIITSYDRASDEDIMRTMEAQPDYAKRFKLSEAGELTAPVVPYTSIEDFRRNKGRLSDTAEEETKALGAEMLELAGKISKNSGVELSQAVDAINNAFIHRYSQSDIVQSFKDSGARISRKNADILQGLYRRAVELSTPYFEAKPQRSVGTEEIAAVVVPDNTSAELKKQLSDEGIRVVEYEAGNEADRLSKMNTLEDVKFSKKNTEYMSAVEKGDVETAQRMVDEAAKAAGYNSPKLYHGTNAFGFTEFDTEKSDDKRTIFLTDNARIASTYSGVSGKRSVSDVYEKKVEGMTAEELSNELNDFAKKHHKDTPQQGDYNYSYYDFEKLNSLIESVNERILNLKQDVEIKIKEYERKMEFDRDDTAEKTLRQLVRLEEKIKNWDYDNLSTPIYMLIHHTDALKENSDIYGDLEADIRLMNDLRKNQELGDGVVVEESLGRYSIEVMNRKEAQEVLKGLSMDGNYELYARLGNSLVVDGKGQNWNNIKGWTASIADKENYALENDGEKYYLKNKKTGEKTEAASVDVDKVGKAPIEDITEFLVSKYKNILDIRYENAKKTRDIAKVAKELGYESVVIKNITDNGGRNSEVGMEETADVYILFDGENIKSADPITYDANGNVIPLSERFNSEKKDIRYSLKGKSPIEAEYWEEKRKADEAKDTSDDDWFDEYVEDINKHGQVIQNKRTSSAESALMRGPKTEKKSLSEKTKESVSFAKRKMVNSGDAIRKIEKKAKAEHLYSSYNRARSASNIVTDMLQNKQTNIRGQKVGESLEAIISPIKAKGEEYWRDFQLYLLHKHNVARMSIHDSRVEEMAREELGRFNKENPSYSTMSEKELKSLSHWDDLRGEKAKKYLELRRNLRKAEKANKPIFFDSDEIPLTAGESRRRAEEILKKHPEFKEPEEKVRKYLDNLMQYRIDSGLITEEAAEYFKKKYPDYVPAYRNTDSVQKQMQGKTNIGKIIGKAKGGDDPILPLDVSISEMTKKVIRNGQKNIFANKLLGVHDKNSKILKEYITEVQEGDFDVDSEMDSFGDEKAFDNTVSFYNEGKRIELTVTPELYEAFDAISKVPKEQPAVAKAVRKVNEFYKKNITTYDPTFLIRNGLKDLQDALLYSKDLKGFAKNYPKAFAEIAKNGEMWQLYQSAGGLYSSRLEELQDKGIGKKKGKLTKINPIRAISYANMMVEQAPRLAEFMSVIEKGDKNDPDVIADALLAAADVTTNFGESGSWGKVLNAYYIPFLNPSIQGAAKIGRTIAESKAEKRWLGLIAKSAILGLGAGFLNDLLNGDDEDYENLDERTKDNYYLFGLGDGEFLKIPKGRVVAALGILSDRVRDAVKGESVDKSEALGRVLENILPENPLNNNILKDWFDADLLDEESKGRTWYGGDIENDSLQSRPVEERYDSQTDYFSRILGKALGVSPKKLNYIIKQYTGGVGRMVLPMITPSEQKGDNTIENIGYGVASMLTSSFTTDSKLSNKVSGEFYDEVDKAEQTKNSSKGTLADKVVYKHLNRERNQMSSYNSKIRKAEDDRNLTGKERQAAVRTASAERTAYQKEVVENLPKYRKAVDKYLKEYPGADEEKKIEYAYRKANYDVYGAEYAIRVNGSSSEHKKALEKVQRGNTTWDEYYDSYFGRDERRYEVISKEYGLSYEQFEKVAEAMSKGKDKEEEIKEIQKVLNCKYNKAEYIRSNYANTK